MYLNLSKEIEVRPAYRNEWEEAMEIAWKTFLVYEAPVYPKKGVQNFWEFIHDETLHRLFLNGAYQLFVAVLQSKVVGMISVREEHHISLLFVDSKYHRQGIGRALITYLSNYLVTEMGKDRMTVNASPYAIPFYHKLGFTDMGPEEVTEGIIYTPMEFYL